VPFDDARTTARGINCGGWEGIPMAAPEGPLWFLWDPSGVLGGSRWACGSPPLGGWLSRPRPDASLPGRWGEEEMSQDEKPEPFQPGEVEEIKKMGDNTTNTKKRRKIRPRKLRIKLRDRVIELRQQGRSHNEIIDIIEQEYGVRLNKPHVSYWTRGLRDPRNDRRGPSLEELEPSPQLAYLIFAILGDGYPKMQRLIRNGHIIRRGVIRFEVTDKEFAEEVARCVSKALNRPPPKLRIAKGTKKDKYCIQFKSMALVELLQDPIDIGKIRKYIEHCEECMASALRALFDAEGCIEKRGYITLGITNYEVLVWTQELLLRFGIESTGPRPFKRKGRPMISPTNGEIYMTTKDCYYIRIRARCNEAFYRYIGFTIRRKQKRLEEYLGTENFNPPPFSPLTLTSSPRLWAP
jgi:intein-encoded DNA endonuclease-like protein